MRSYRFFKKLNHKKLPLRFKGSGGAFLSSNSNGLKQNFLADNKYIFYNIALAIAIVLIFIGIIIGDNYAYQQKKFNEKNLIAQSWANIGNSERSLQPFFKNIMDYEEILPDGYVWFNRLDLSCKSRFGIVNWVVDYKYNIFNCHPKRVNLFNLDLKAQLDERGDWVRRAELSRANFDGAYLSYADFYGARLIATKFRGIIGTEAKFEKSILIGADFRGAMLKGAQFVNSNLRQADFSNANLSSANFENTLEFSTAKFDNAWAFSNSLPKGLNGIYIKLCENNNKLDDIYNAYLSGQVKKFDIDDYSTCQLKKL